MSYSEPGRTANESPHATVHPGENIASSEQSVWHNEAMQKQLLGDNLMKRTMVKN